MTDRPDSLDFARLSSRRLEGEDEHDIANTFYSKGWTDGLPIVAPTEQRVAAMLAGAGLAPDVVVGNFVERRVEITAEKVAINAVMAGCLPEYMPVVVAGTKAMLHPDFGLHGILASGGGTSLMLIVNGPITRKLDINSGVNCLGPGNRANATIGRAITLIARNLCGRAPGILEKSVFGHPANYTFCVAENEADERWEPLHVQRGFARDRSTVTVFPAQGGGFLINSPMSVSAEDLMLTVARMMRSVHISRFGHSFQVVLLGQEALNTLALEGWTKKDVREFLYKRATWSMAELKRPPRLARTTEVGGIDISAPLQPGDEHAHYPILAEPDAVLVLTAGAAAQRMMLVVPSMAEYKLESTAVTIPVDG